MKIINWLKGRASKKGGILIWLIMLSLLDVYLLDGFASDYFDLNEIHSGLIAFALFTALGIMMVSIIRLSRNLLETKMAEKEAQSALPAADSISPEAFQTAIQKLHEEIHSAKETQPPKDSGQVTDHVFIKVDGKIHKVSFDSILYVEANRNSTKFILEDTQLHPIMTFNSVEELLPKKHFFRLHRSFIINKTKISHIEGNRAFIGAMEIPIGANYKEAFMRYIGIAI